MSYFFKNMGYTTKLFYSSQRKIIHYKFMNNPFVGKQLVFGKFKMGFYEDNKHFHTTVFIRCLNTKMKIEEVPVDQNISKIENNVTNETKTVSTIDDKSPGKIKKIIAKIKHELVHYYHGFRLFVLECVVAGGIVFRILTGHKLTRRERKQLIRTSADLFKMMPFMVMVIVPLMEFLLPIYLKFFPFMLPSTFKVESKDKEFALQKLKGKLEIAKFLQESIEERASVKSTIKEDGVDLETFSKFLKQTRESGLIVETNDILRFSHLFEDQVTLESLSPKYLKALCKLLEINSMGPPVLLRFQLEMKVRQLKADDEMIVNEGVEKIPVWELQQLCRERGMRSYGVNEDRLRYQLNQWLSLSLEKKVPTTLLLLSRVMYLPETLTPEEQLKQAILVLPETVSKTAKLKVADTEEIVDRKTKIEVIKEVQEIIKQEREEAKKIPKEAEIIPPIDAPLDKAPVIEITPEETPDKAPIISIPDAVKEVVVEKPQLQQDVLEKKPITETPVTQISAQDLAHIGTAIANLDDTKTLFEKEELDTLKENRQEISKTISSTDKQVTVEKKEELVVQRLTEQLDKMIDQIDKSMEHIEGEEKTEEPSEMDKKREIEDLSTKSDDSVSTVKTERFINISDILESLKTLEKKPDDAKWETILALMDEDQDGKIEMNHLIKMINLLNTNDIKLSSSEIKKLLEVIDKEDFIAEIKKTPPSKDDKQ